MSSPIVTKAAATRFPANLASVKGVFRLSVSGTAASFALPAEFKGCFVSVTARGATVQLGVGLQQTLVYDASNTGFADFKATVGASIKADESFRAMVDKSATHLNVVASGAGTIEVCLDEVLGF